MQFVNFAPDGYDGAKSFTLEKIRLLQFVQIKITTTTHIYG